MTQLGEPIDGAEVVFSQEQAKLYLRSRSLWAIVAALSIATPGMARDVFECDFPTVGGNLGYLPDVVVLSREAGSDTATLVDPIIQTEKGGPIEVKIAEENDRKLSVSWSIMLKSTLNDYIKMQYRVSIQKGSLAASVVGRPLGFANNFTAQGTCKRLEG